MTKLTHRETIIKFDDYARVMLVLSEAEFSTLLEVLRYFKPTQNEEVFRAIVSEIRGRAHSDGKSNTVTGLDHKTLMLMIGVIRHKINDYENEYKILCQAPNHSMLGISHNLEILHCLIVKCKSCLERLNYTYGVPSLKLDFSSQGPS
ncbi:MAG TPA: hypothetical protein VMW36_01140 [Patescibacteria group bacterium]|nr:hypothetical protein [Patescibacteria group bacterium]